MCAFYDAPGSFETTPGTTSSAASASQKRVGRAAEGLQAGLTRCLQRNVATCPRDLGSATRPNARGPTPRPLGPASEPKAPPFPVPTWMTLRLRPVMSASFCSVCASGLLSCANCACITWRARGAVRHKYAEVSKALAQSEAPAWRTRPRQLQPRLATRGTGRGGARRPSQPRPHQRPSHTRPLAPCLGTCNCSAVNDVRARLAGLG